MRKAKNLMKYALHQDKTSKRYAIVFWQEESIDGIWTNLINDRFDSKAAAYSRYLEYCTDVDEEPQQELKVIVSRIADHLYK